MQIPTKEESENVAATGNENVASPMSMKSEESFASQPGGAKKKVSRKKKKKHQTVL